MKKVLVIGSINIDLVVNVKNLPVKGETILGTDFNQYFGGKGANQAYALAKFGAPTTMLAQVGNDAGGQQAIANLQAIGIDTAPIHALKDVPTGTAIITVDENGSNEIVLVGGANQVPMADSLLEAEIAKADIVVLQLEIPLAVVEKAITYAHSQNKYVILNPAPGRALTPDLISACDLLVPNETELATIMGVEYVDDEKVIVENARELAKKSAVDLLVTMGEHGSIYFAKNGGEIVTKAHKVKAIDTTAAGDTFIGGYVSQLAAGATKEAALEFATKAGALAVLKKGAQPSIPTTAEVLNFKV